jgi:catechol 2,3-dioxygenase-like lactoylglutathione lyase family enzyme
MGSEIIGFDHMVLKSRDVEKALWFYGEVLGMEILRLEHFRAGNCGFPSVRVSENTIIDLPPDPSTKAIVENVDHFCLVIETTDMAALQLELKAKGVKVEDAEPHYAYGACGQGLQFKLWDPNGHKLELRCYP